ncbi:MAG: hypothetical protein NT010_11080 [Proteobacteria bacterium]|nr:hypothetical protein [Pseudomonadota bacterium]
MKTITFLTEVRQHGKQGHRFAGSALSKYRLCTFGRSLERSDEPYGEVVIPIKMVEEQGYPTSITLNFEK